MSKLKFQIRLSYKVELFGTGFYKGLSSQYKKKYPELTTKLDEAAAHEYEHSILFSNCYNDMFNKKIGGEGFWLGTGKCMSYLMYALPISLKLKNASGMERLAVKMLEKDIASGQENQYIEVAKKILPDEKKHADLYRDWKKM